MELIEMFWMIIFFLKLFLLEISTVKKNNKVNKHVSMNYSCIISEMKLIWLFNSIN